MYAKEQRETVSIPQSGIQIRTQNYVVGPDGYFDDEEVTVRSLPVPPMPIILNRWQLSAICTGCVLVGTLIPLAMWWL